MSPDHDPRLSPDDEPEQDFEEEEAPRSIFSAAWFRVVLVLLGVAIVGAVSVPYVLDVVTPPADTPGVRTVDAPPPPAAPASSTSAPAAPPSEPPTATPSTPAAKPSAAAPTPGAPAASKPGAPTSSAATTPTAPKRSDATTSTSAAAPPASASAPKPSTPSSSATPAPSQRASAPKPAAPASQSAKASEGTAARVGATTAERAEPKAPAAAKLGEGGDYFVQVGAYRDQATAKRVASRLREQNYPVDESVKRVGAASAAAPRPGARETTTSGPDRYDVIVSGGSSADINSKLAAKGLASEPAGDGVRIRPSLSLRDAVALSKDLGSEGFKVQVRRGGAPGSEPSVTVPPAGEGGSASTLHRVRVGGYADRAAAQTILKELQGKGFQPFIAQGRD
jgi:hypothetical protein